MSTDTTKIYLQQVQPLTGLRDEELAEIRAYLDICSFERDEVLFREGDPGDSLYIIRRGSVVVHKSHEGRPVVIADRRAHDVVGEMALIDQSPRFATVVAVEPTECYVLSRAKFISALSDHPTVAMRILEVLSRRVRETDQQRLKDLQEQHCRLQVAHDRLRKLVDELETTHQQLASSMSFRQRLVDAAPYPIIVTDPADVVLLANPEAVRLFGDLPEGATLRDVIGPACENAQGGGRIPTPLIDMLEDGQSFRGDVELRGRGPESIFCRLAASPIDDEDGQQRLLWIFEDMTEMRQLERQAIQREQLAMKGEMAAEIAHEMNNFLAVLAGNVELLPLAMSSGQQDRIDKCLAGIKSSLERIGVFTSTMLASRRPDQPKTIIDFNTFFENQLAFLRPQKKFKKLKFETHWDESLPSIEMDVVALQQIFYNLALNAVESLSEAPSERYHVTVATRFDPISREISFIVADNGVGIDPAVRDRLFAERISTKPTGHGFGLTTIRRLLDECGGRISVDDRADGPGAEFTVVFPVPEDTNPDQRQQAVSGDTIVG